MNGHLAFRAGQSHACRGFIILLVESGAVLTAANIVALVLERLKHSGLHAILDISTPLALGDSAYALASYPRMSANGCLSFANGVAAAGTTRSRGSSLDCDSARFSPDLEKQAQGPRHTVPAGRP
ncbi:hypothetical protein BD413DRAFT_616487 [Trametes elegans]|nr:hypothetical protein BD413DRAFT_616487 [Trametes elegans]